MRLAIRMAVAAGLWLVLGLAWAQRVEGDRATAQGMYQDEVQVNGQGENERNAGFARAMVDILNRLSGDRSAASRPGVGQELRRAHEYVDSYDYRQDEGVSATTGAPTYTTTLIVRFDQDRIDDIVAALGLPVWPQPRPKPVLWLAIDDGSGPRLVGLPKASAARSVLDRAVTRGYRLGLPAGSAAEQAAVGAIWRGDTAAIARISAHYNPPMQLLGKLYRSGTGWTGNWTFVDHGKVLAQWSSSDRDARRAMAAGADGAADALVRRYARAANAGSPGTYRVAFAGIGGSEDYMRLSGYLQGMSVVRRITPVRATPERLELDLELATGLPGFRRIAGDDLVETDAGAGAEPPVFRLH